MTLKTALNTEAELKSHYLQVRQRLNGTKVPVKKPIAVNPRFEPAMVEALITCTRRSTDECIFQAAHIMLKHDIRSIVQVQAIVAKLFGVNVSDLTGDCRLKRYVVPRFVAIVLCRRLLGSPLLLLGSRFNRDHTTVLSAMARMGSVVDNVLESEKFRTRSLA